MLRSLKLALLPPLGPSFGLAAALLVLLITPAQARSRNAGADPVVVCVLAPRVEAVDEGDAVGALLSAKPLLVVVEPLQEVRIERAGRLLWRGRAGPGQSIRAPLPWPLAPIQPGEQLLLRLQPVGASAESFAHVQLRGASAARMASTAALIERLGPGPQAWLAAVETALQDGDVALAWALLFAPQAPQAGELDSLRAEVLRRGCGE